MNHKSTDELAKILWSYNCLGQRIEKSDVIIGLGSHDTRTADRSAELYLQGFAPYLLFSGGFGRLTAKDWAKSEAEIFSEIALKKGVNPEALIIENKSTNTGENLTFSMKLMNEMKINVNKVILVHKPYMERRALATWLNLFPNIKAIVTSPQMSYDVYINESPITKDETINIIVGETQRIKLYSERGFTVTQEIPTEVWQAYEELINRGFVAQLVKN